MSKRFGRNQRRKLREQLAEQLDRNAHLERQAELHDREVWQERKRFQDAKTHALREFAANEDLMRLAIEKITHHLKITLPGHITQHLDPIIAQNEGPFFKLSCHDNFVRPEVRMIRGQIPSLNYETAVAMEKK